MTFDGWLSCPECGYDYAEIVVLAGNQLGAKCERCEHTDVTRVRRLES